MPYYIFRTFAFPIRRLELVAQVADEWTFRQLVAADGGWQLRALNPAYPATGIADLSPLRGVVIQ